MSNYLIELAIIHLTLILGYWFFLSNERQYAIMRFYLLGTTLLALIIPLLKLQKLFFNGQELNNGSAFVEAIPFNAVTNVAPANEWPIWSYDLFILLYIAISMYFLFKLLHSVVYLLYLLRKSTHEKFDDLYIRKVRNIKGSFTFFNWIFLGDEIIDKNHQDYELILKHEKAHTTLGHTYDVIFFELYKACVWWLPTAWFINKEIRKIHEYQADACALKSYNVDQYSSILISSTLKTNGLSLASSFHDGLILKRLKAMKQQAKIVSLWKLGVLGSLSAILFVVFSCSEEPETKTEKIGSQSNIIESKTEGDVFTTVEENPQFPGGTVALYEYLAREIRYPLEAKTQGIEGRVFVQFIVEKDGSISDVKSIRGIGAGCDQEAVRVIQNAPYFKSGTQRGVPVRVRMVLPIIFKLNQYKSKKDTQGTIEMGKIDSRNDKLKVEANYADGEWSGTVYNSEGGVLAGANIIVGGTTAGTVSNIDGTFKLKAHESKPIYISFAGYEVLRLEKK